MKATIWVETLEGHYCEIGSGSKLYFEVVTKENPVLKTKLFDVVQYDITKKLLTESDIYVIYESKDEKKSEFVYNRLWEKVQEKKEVLEERRALKKCVDPLLKKMARERDKRLRNQLFEVKIKDILNEYKEQY